MEELLQFLFRWGHVVFGVAWIGLLYYFNFVQGGYMAKASGEAKVDAFTKLVPSALWWFRWAAMFTFLTGLVLLYFIMTGLSVGILVGALMGTPDVPQRVAHHLAEPKGGHRLQRGGARWRRSRPQPGGGGGQGAACVAHQHAVLAAHAVLHDLAHAWRRRKGAVVTAGGMGDLAVVGMWVSLVAVLAIEANALFGQTGPITTVKGVISSSVVLTVALGLVVGML